MKVKKITILFIQTQTSIMIKKKTEFEFKDNRWYYLAKSLNILVLHFTFRLYIYLNLKGSIECIPGYIGMNCSSECPYPSYGRKCHGLCNCSKNQCDVSTGCKTVTTGNIRSYTVYDICWYSCYLNQYFCAVP